MNSQLPTITLILSLLALLAGAYSIWQIFSLNRLRKNLFGGSRALDLEEVITKLGHELKSQQGQLDALDQTLGQLKNTLTFAVQKVGLVRFNPFSDGGGNFSFTLALLDAKNSGIVITSMYGREHSRIYTKKIDEGKCEIQLTEEEAKAVSLANNQNTN